MIELGAYLLLSAIRQIPDVSREKTGASDRLL